MNDRHTSPGQRGGTKITIGLCALAAAGASLIIAASIAEHPDRIDAWRHAARYTARFSFLIFLTVFVARPVYQLWPSQSTRWMVSHRRALGLAFATAHFTHLYALMRFRLTTDQLPGLSVLVPGGVAYLLLAAMVVTSNDASVRALGARNWKRLHTVGIYWIWVVFFRTYVVRIVAGETFFLLFAVGAAAALCLRLVAGARTESRAALGAPGSAA